MENESLSVFLCVNKEVIIVLTEHVTYVHGINYKVLISLL